MKLLQLYYTSCERGRSSGPGFQVYAASEGLTEEEIAELEQICLYIPPDHLPSQPTEEEIRAHFPISFSSFQLRSGRYGIFQSVYVGKDYSGRFGNYFSHALIVEEGEWPFASSLLYGSPDLRTRLTTDEAGVSTQPAPLPTLDMQTPNGTITPSLVQEFLQKEGRYTQLEKLLNGLIESEGKPGALTFVAEPNQVPYWVAAIQLAFPEQIATNLTFSTYAYDPDRTNYVISATLTEGTRFSQSFGRRSNTYSVDLINNQFSEPEMNSRYVKYVINEQLNIKELKDFAAFFNLKKPSSALDDFIDLYNLCNHNDMLTADHLKKAIQFAEDYRAPEHVQHFVNETFVEKLITSCADLENASIIANFLMNTGKQTENVIYDRLAATFILEKTANLIADGFSEELVDSFLTQHMEQMTDQTIIRKLFLQDEKLQNLQAHLQEMNQNDSYLFHGKFATKMIIQEGLDWKDLTDVQKTFFVSLSNRILLQSDIEVKKWNVLTTSPVFFAQLLTASLATKKSVNELSSSIATHLSAETYNSNWYETFYSTLNEKTIGKEFVEQSIIAQLQSSQDIDQMTKFLVHASDQSENTLSKLVSVYIDKLLQTEQGLLRNLADVIDTEHIGTIVKKNRRFPILLNEGSKSIQFSDQSIEKETKVYKQLAYHCNDIELTDSVYGLVLVTYENRSSKNKEFQRLEKAIGKNLTNKSFVNDQLTDYLRWHLVELIESIYQQKKQQSSLRTSLIQKHTDKVLPVIMDRRNKIKTTYINELIADLFVGYHKGYPDENLNEQLVKFLETYTYDGKKIEKHLKEHPPFIEKWNDLDEEIQQSEGGSFMKSIKKIFGSKR